MSAWSIVPVGIAMVTGLLLTAGPSAAQVQDQKLLVQAQVGEVCTVTAASLDFGTYAFTPVTRTGNITIQCLTPTALNVALDGGHAGNGNGLRTMSNGGSNIIYQLFKDAGFGVPWITGGTTPSPSNTSHTVNVYGMISTSQNPGPLADGAYTDEVTITLVF